MGTPLPIQAATIGWSDSLILMLMALVVFGPRKLPQLGRQLGKLMYEFRKASNDFKFQMEEELRSAEEADRRKREEAERAAAAAAAPSAEVAAPATQPEPAENTDDANNPYRGYTEYVQQQEAEAAAQSATVSPAETPVVAAAPLEGQQVARSEDLLHSASLPTVESALKPTAETSAANTTTETAAHNG